MSMPHAITPENAKSAISTILFRLKDSGVKVKRHEVVEAVSAALGFETSNEMNAAIEMACTPHDDKEQGAEHVTDGYDAMSFDLLIKQYPDLTINDLAATFAINSYLNTDKLAKPSYCQGLFSAIVQLKSLGDSELPIYIREVLEENARELSPATLIQMWLDATRAWERKLRDHMGIDYPDTQKPQPKEERKDFSDDYLRLGREIATLRDNVPLPSRSNYIDKHSGNLNGVEASFDLTVSLAMEDRYTPPMYWLDIDLYDDGGQLMGGEGRSTLTPVETATHEQLAELARYATDIISMVMATGKRRIAEVADYFSSVDATNPESMQNLEKYRLFIRREHAGRQAL